MTFDVVVNSEEIRKKKPTKVEKSLKWQLYVNISIVLKTWGKKGIFNIELQSVLLWKLPCTT